MIPSGQSCITPYWLLHNAISGINFYPLDSIHRSLLFGRPILLIATLTVRLRKLLLSLTAIIYEKKVISCIKLFGVVEQNQFLILHYTLFLLKRNRDYVAN